MEGFFDSDKFQFVEMEFDGKNHMVPIHYRDLGKKEKGLYSKKVSWSDVVINAVPLEQTFEFERDNTIRERTGEREGIIIVNERQTQMPLPDDDEDYPIHPKNKWMNRLSKISLNPVTLPEAKKKRKSIER